MLQSNLFRGGILFLLFCVLSASMLVDAGGGGSKLQENASRNSFEMDVKDLGDSDDAGELEDLENPKGGEESGAVDGAESSIRSWFSSLRGGICAHDRRRGYDRRQGWAACGVMCLLLGGTICLVTLVRPPDLNMAEQPECSGLSNYELIPWDSTEKICSNVKGNERHPWGDFSSGFALGCVSQCKAALLKTCAPVCLVSEKEGESWTPDLNGLKDGCDHYFGADELVMYLMCDNNDSKLRFMGELEKRGIDFCNPRWSYYGTSFVYVFVSEEHMPTIREIIGKEAFDEMQEDSALMESEVCKKYADEIRDTLRCKGSVVKDDVDRRMPDFLAQKYGIEAKDQNLDFFKEASEYKTET